MSVWAASRSFSCSVSSRNSRASVVCAASFCHAATVASISARSLRTFWAACWSFQKLDSADCSVRAAARAPWSQVRRYSGGHFDIYRGEGFERAVSDQVAFLRSVLQPIPAGIAT